MTNPVRPADRVRDVIARDTRLIDVFVAQSSYFEKLRNPVMRRIMAGVITVEQAARIAGVSTSQLVAALNAKLGIATLATTDAGERAMTHAAPRHPQGRIVMELDVRDDLRSGREPFTRIMHAVSVLGDDVLHVRAPFEPVPLVSVLGQRGLACETAQHGADDWSLWAWRTGREPTVEAAPAAPAVAETSASERGDEIWLDVRGMEPPEPMARTLVVLETLPPGVTFVQLNARVPQFLLPVLDERGFTYEIDYEIDDAHAGRVLVRIRRGP